MWFGSPRPWKQNCVGRPAWMTAPSQRSYIKNSKGTFMSKIHQIIASLKGLQGLSQEIMQSLFGLILALAMHPLGEVCQNENFTDSILSCLLCDFLKVEFWKDAGTEKYRRLTLDEGLRARWHHHSSLIWWEVWYPPCQISGSVLSISAKLQIVTKQVSRVFLIQCWNSHASVPGLYEFALQPGNLGGDINLGTAKVVLSERSGRTGCMIDCRWRELDRIRDADGKQ